MRWRSHICVFLLEWHHHSHSHMVSWRRRAVHTYSHACQHEFMLQSMDWFAGLWLRKNIDRTFVPSKMDGCQSLSLSLVQFAVVHEDILDHCTNHYISNPLCVCVCVWCKCAWHNGLWSCLKSTCTKCIYFFQIGMPLRGHICPCPHLFRVRSYYSVFAMNLSIAYLWPLYRCAAQWHNNNKLLIKRKWSFCGRRAHSAHATVTCQIRNNNFITKLCLFCFVVVSASTPNLCKWRMVWQRTMSACRSADGAIESHTHTPLPLSTFNWAISVGCYMAIDTRIYFICIYSTETHTDMVKW